MRIARLRYFSIYFKSMHEPRRFSALNSVALPPGVRRRWYSQITLVKMSTVAYVTDMIYHVSSFSCNTGPVTAGQPFKLTVVLDRVVEGQDVTVYLEKQRLVLAGGGFPELRPTGSTYFELNPRPIVVKVGSQQGTSDDIKVKTNASVGGNEPPVVFPEQLVFSAFDVGTGPVPGTFRSEIVPISAAGPT